ncbi:MAG: hypothetical protein FWG42_00185 [Clostridiales bacterium]|nr:hypothetical protein [Clostridiales bacterium]
MSDPINGANSIANNHYVDMQIQSAVQRAASTTEAGLGMNDFIRLLVAQLQNQDMLNPMDNTEFIAQMATFSTLTAINSMAEQSMTSYAVSLLGKEVTAAAFNTAGNLEKTTGVVTGVSLFEGSPKVYIGDKAFDLQSVMTVGKLPEPESQNEPEDRSEPEVDEHD